MLPKVPFRLPTASLALLRMAAWLPVHLVPLTLLSSCPSLTLQYGVKVGRAPYYTSAKPQ